MVISYKLSDDNSAFTGVPPVIVPIKWRYLNTTTTFLTEGEVDIVHPTTPATIFDPISQSVSGWSTGGSATVSTQMSVYDNPSPSYFNARVYWTRPINVPLGLRKQVGSGKYAWIGITATLEIDWEATMSTLRTSLNPSVYKIAMVRWVDSLGDNPVDLVSEGLVSLNELNQYYNNLDNIGEVVRDSLFNEITSLTPESIEYDTYDGNTGEYSFVSDFEVKGVSDTDQGLSFNDDAHALIPPPPQGASVSDSRSLDMYLKVWVAIASTGSGAGSMPEPDEAVVKPVDEINPIDWPSLGGTSGSTGAGSSEQGLNDISSLYGNSELPFDSVYLTGLNYNSLISAGGGIVSNSGIFPNSDTIYIDTIRLSVDGSTMTIVEVVDYDDTPSLTVSDKIYGYLFNSTNKTKPVFSGYVISQKRRCSGKTREIVYECRDLSYFFGQLYSPSHYIYRPPSLDGSGTVKTYDRVLKEVLNVAGVPTAIIDIPNYTAPPVNWIYQGLKSVLEWATKYFGKYVYYIDRYGRLNFRATDSLSNVKTYTIGDKSGEIAVEEFNPIKDFSRSRSRIVLTGDYEITEHELQANYSGNVTLDPNDNDSQTGIFHFNQVIAGVTYTFYYFMLKPGSTLNDKLLSDPSKSAQITLMKQNTVQSWTVSGLVTSDESKIDSPKELSVKVFKSQPGDSEIYVEDSVLNFSGVQVIRARYATRTDSPIQVYTDTGRFGGTEVVRRPEFKKLTSSDNTIDDTALMQQYLSSIVEFYKPVYGGGLILDGLDTDIHLLAKVSIAGTNLSSEETDDLICYSIEYNVKEKRTSVDLSNRVFSDLPFFDSIRERSRENNEVLSKMGLLEEMELYKRI